MPHQTGASRATAIHVAVFIAVLPRLNAAPGRRQHDVRQAALMDVARSVSSASPAGDPRPSGLCAATGIVVGVALFRLAAL